jgi:uncharacterized delta-60 repeat protein
MVETMKKITAILIVSLFLISIVSVYAKDGDLIWGKTYDSENNDEARDVATDSQNNVIVTGININEDEYYDYCTVKYDSNGNKVWEKIYGEEYRNEGAWGVATDSQNNVIVTGYVENANNDYYTIKYDSNGNVIWAMIYDAEYMAEARDVATDSQNNVIVTGSVNNGKSCDYYTIKYDSSGNQIWAKTYDSGNDEEAYGVATDSQNNVIVTGYVNNGKSYDYYTIKYDSSGNQIWAKTSDSGNNDFGNGIATDSQNNVIVTGYFRNSDLNRDYYTVKYDSNGNELWARTHNGGSDDEALRVASDSQNNVIVTGSVYSDDSKRWDYYTIKYNSNGNIIWSQSNEKEGWDYACGVATDSQNNVIVTGYVENDTEDYFTIKYEGVPPTTNKSIPMAQILKILGLYPKE